MVKEIKVTDSISYEYPPDGSILPVIDPYDGCTINCPYCFQRTDVTWNKQLIAKINIHTLIKKKFVSFNCNEVYIGSRCDPYLKLERKYQLTRKCLIELQKINQNTMLCTKGDAGLIERDIDVIKQFNQKFTLVMGLSNLDNLRKYKRISENPGMKIIRKFLKEKINVWVFLTPVLPGILDIDEISQYLPDHVPVHLDKLRIENNSIQAKLLLRYIKKYFFNLYPLYNDIINNGNELYFEEIKDKHYSDKRFVFDFE